MKLTFGVLLLSLGLFLGGCDQGQRSYVVTGTPPSSISSSGLPLPSSVPSQQYQEQLYAFVGSREYLELGWAKDKGIRDTGPYQNGVYYGTHPAVRIYYSPEMMTWLINGRQGELSDGAMLIKEMYPPPAVRYTGRNDDIVPTEWTIMVRDKGASADGWYWSYYSSNPDNSNPPVGQAPDNNTFPFNYPNSGFGLYCVRCHGSAANTLTYASTENIEGFPGQPQVYAVDDSWITGPNQGSVPHPNEDNDIDSVPIAIQQALSEGAINQDFLDYFDQFPAARRSQIEALAPVTTDHVVARTHRDFVTSDQCLSCHSGDNSPFGPNMIKDDTDISPFGEWAWSMMGLAGRDPIFFAQLESETALHTPPGGDLTAAAIQNRCLHCHGVMGQRQFTTDNPGQLFTTQDAMASGESDPHKDYGGLARDGVSCMVCHQIADQTGIPLEQIETGDFLLAPAVDGVRSIFGPFENPTVKPMLDSLGLRPVQGKQITNSQLCASCHTVKLPVLNAQGKSVAEKYEQATYPEWQNSSFSQYGARFQSCQDCHLPKTFHNSDPLEFKIANVEDQDFPFADGLAPRDEITVEPRPDFARHSLAGINVFGLAFFQQYPDILGVRTRSFMTGFDNGLANSVQNSLDQAEQSARIDILDSTIAGSLVETKLKVRSLVGHRFPSGVGFRRLFLQFSVLDGSGQTVWASGRTNDLGLIVDGNGTPLPSESHAADPSTGQQTYQPHYQVVDSESKAQIYEELIKDTEGRFTTSFLARAVDVKDNRLLPLGWTAHGASGMSAELVESTQPAGQASTDPDFTDGTGSDTITYRSTLPSDAQGPFTVQAQLFYQAIPPIYLQDRFKDSDGPATQRLHYMGSRLDLKKTPFPGWKLAVTQAVKAVTH